ncbi:MAG: DUF433 domain-containing protein [Anaerolineae bacterium]|nr:DUF433 domain-containing protein [Anaerolineae bacterium]
MKKKTQTVPVAHLEMVDGTAYVAGRKVKVRVLAELHLEGGTSAEELTARYHITLAEFHTAMAYYFDHQAEFEAERKALQAAMDAARADSAARLEQMKARQSKPGTG